MHVAVSARLRVVSRTLPTDRLRSALRTGVDSRRVALLRSRSGSLTVARRETGLGCHRLLSAGSFRICGVPVASAPTRLSSRLESSSTVARAMATGAEGGGLIDRAATVEEEELLESFSLIASIDKAWCRVSPVGQNAGPKGKGAPGKASLDVTVQMSQKNLPANAMRKYLSTVHVPDPQGDLSSFHWSPFPTELTGVTLIAPSPSGGRLLVVRNGEPGVGGKEAGAVKLEVWGAGRLLREVHVPATVHGGVYADGWFEGVSWNEDETCVAYVAEEPAPPKPVFGQPRQPAATSAAQHPPAAPAGPARGRFGAAAAAAPAPAVQEGKGEWMEDWGERYAGKQRPLLFVLNTAFQEEEGGEDEGVGRETRGEAVASGVISQHCHVRKGGVVVNASGWISKLLFVGWSAFPLTVSHRLSPSVTTLYHSVPLCTALYPSLCLSQWHTAGGRGHSGGHQCGAGGVGADSGGAAAHAVLRRLVLLLLSLSLTFSYCSVPLCAALSPCSGTVQAVEGIPGDISAGQVVWAPAVEGQQHTLLFVGWSAFPSNFNTARRLGIVYCANRPCHLFAAQAPSQDPAGKKPGSGSSIVKLTAGISSAFSPRFSPDGSLLVFLSSHAAVDSGTHGATNSLHSLLWPKEGISFPHAPPADPEEDTRSGPSDVPAIDIPINSIVSVRLQVLFVFAVGLLGKWGVPNSLHSLLCSKEGISFPHAPPADPEEESRSGLSNVPAIDIPINSRVSVRFQAVHSAGRLLIGMVRCCPSLGVANSLHSLL
ncbi:unnamed protein product [Closterium sp. NIES-64]|nr:unnamed protein product [Closterium sp. NIES-64]